MSFFCVLSHKSSLQATEAARLIVCLLNWNWVKNHTLQCSASGEPWEHFLETVVKTPALWVEQTWSYRIQRWNQDKHLDVGLKATDCEMLTQKGKRTRWWWYCRQTGKLWCAGLRWSRWSAEGRGGAAAPWGRECDTETLASERWSAAAAAAASSWSLSDLHVKRKTKPVRKRSVMLLNRKVW